MLSQDLFEAAPSNLGQDTLRQLQAIAASGQNADLKIGVEMMPLQPWQATYLMGVYKSIKQKYGVDKALLMLGNYDFVDHALAKQEEKLANISRVGSIPSERGVGEGAMPAAVIRVKEKIRTMSDAEKREYFKGKSHDELRALARRHGYGADSNVYTKYATEKDKQEVDEDVKFPYPPRSEKLGRANFSLLTRAYNEPTGPRLTLNFGDRVIDLDRDDVEAIADYYDNELKTPDARMNFIRIVMSDADNMSDVLRRLGRRSDSQQPGLFQEAKKKDDDELGAQTKDVALQRAISRAKADFPSAGSGIEALAKDFIRSQEQDQKSFDQLRDAERKQQQMLDQMSKLDQRQDQEIDDLENANNSLSQRIQQLQSVNSELEKKLASMSGRKSKAEKPASITVIEPGRSAVAATAPAAKDTTEPAAQPAARKTTPRRFKKSTGIPRIKSSIPRRAQEPARLTTQNPDILEPIGGRRPSPFAGQGDAVDVVSRMAQSLAGNDQATDKKVNRYSPPESIKKTAANDTRMEPAANVAETRKKSEADYGSDYQDMVRRVGKMAKQGPRKTVWDPVKRVYKTVPVNPPKDQGVAEGWKDVVAGGAMALGALGAQAQTADLSGYNTQYLQQVAAGEHARPMVSMNDAKAELQARANGKQTVAPATKPQASSGYSKEYLQKAADPDRFGRYMISVEKAQELLRNMQEDVTENHGMAEGQELSWRVEGAGSGHSHRYYVVKGYGKTGKGWDKMWKGQHGTGDFVSKERAEQKAEELNQNLRDNKK